MYFRTRTALNYYRNGVDCSVKQRPIFILPSHGKASGSAGLCDIINGGLAGGGGDILNNLGALHAVDCDLGSCSDWGLLHKCIKISLVETTNESIRTVSVLVRLWEMKPCRKWS